jgi:hypothetical protein
MNTLPRIFNIFHKRDLRDFFLLILTLILGRKRNGEILGDVYFERKIIEP